MRIVENKYCTEKDDCVKKMTGHHSKRVGFYCEQKKKVYLQTLTLEKTLKTFITEFMLVVKFKS